MTRPNGDSSDRRGPAGDGRSPGDSTGDGRRESSTVEAPAPEFRRTALHLFVSSQGADTRRRIVTELVEGEPTNANRLARALDLDYTTVRYHLERLQGHGLVETAGRDEGYDVRYAPSPALEANWEWVRSLPDPEASGARGARGRGDGE